MRKFMLYFASILALIVYGLCMVAPHAVTSGDRVAGSILLFTGIFFTAGFWFTAGVMFASGNLGSISYLKLGRYRLLSVLKDSSNNLILQLEVSGAPRYFLFNGKRESLDRATHMRCQVNKKGTDYELVPVVYVPEKLEPEREEAVNLTIPDPSPAGAVVSTKHGGGMLDG